MYGDLTYGGDRASTLSNEVAIANLIAIANNPTLFNTLDPDTKASLVEIIGGYARGAVVSILTAKDKDSGIIRENIR